MEMPNINIKQTFNNGLDSIQKGYDKKIKPAVDNGIKYTKGLANDTIDFVAKNPKKTGLIAAGAAIAVSLAAIVTKFLHKNSELKELAKVQNEHIGHQSQIIDALKEDIAERQIVMDSLHEAIEAAHNHIQKNAEKS